MRRNLKMSDRPSSRSRSTRSNDFDLTVAGAFGLGLWVVVINEIGDLGGASKRRRVGDKQRVFRLEMRAFAQELGAPLGVDGGCDGVRKVRGLRLGISRGWKPNGVDPERKAAAKPGEARIDAACQIIQLGWGGALTIGAAVEEAGQQRAVLAQHESIADQTREIQEIGGALGAVAELFQAQHGGS